MVKIENLKFAYKKRKPVFSELNLELESGKIYGLLGKNGSGKTTLLKNIAGLLHPDAGKILIKGKESKNRTPDLLESYYMIPEEFETPSLNAETFLKITAPFYKNFKENDFLSYLKEFNIDLNQKLSKMSYGQKKKFLISFGMATDTPLLITDEPTNGLDIPSKSIFRKLTASAINENKTFIISTHQVKDIEGIIDTIIVLENGKIIFNKSTEEISEKLCFKTVNNADNDKVLYAEKNITGYSAILKNESGIPSNIDYELLFNSIIDENSKVINEFN